MVECIHLTGILGRSEKVSTERGSKSKFIFRILDKLDGMIELFIFTSFSGQIYLLNTT